MPPNSPLPKPEPPRVELEPEPPVSAAAVADADATSGSVAEVKEEIVTPMMIRKAEAELSSVFSGVYISSFY
jgi:hypothetical protein